MALANEFGSNRGMRSESGVAWLSVKRILRLKPEKSVVGIGFSSITTSPRGDLELDLRGWQRARISIIPRGIPAPQDLDLGIATIYYHPFDSLRRLTNPKR